MARSNAYAVQNRRVERDAARRRRELAAQEKEKAAWQERRRAEHEVLVYENQIDFLLSMHKDAGPTWDWAEVVSRRAPAPPTRTHVFAEKVRATASSLPSEPRPTHSFEEQYRSRLAMPPPPQPTNALELQARQAAANYRPTFLQSVFGSEATHRSALQAAIDDAQRQDGLRFAAAQAEYARQLEQYRRGLAEAQHRDAAVFESARKDYAARVNAFHQASAEAERRDAETFAAAQAEHAQALAQLAWEQQVAAGVLTGDLAAFRAVLEHLAPFAELGESGMDVTVDVLRNDVAVLRCIVANDEIMPREKKELSAAGKLVTKTIPSGTYWAVYQDYVCGCALRAAR